MLDTVKINHVQHISFTQSRLTDAVSVILSELLSYEHPSNWQGAFCTFLTLFRHFQVPVFLYHKGRKKVAKCMTGLSPAVTRSKWRRIS